MAVLFLTARAGPSLELSVAPWRDDHVVVLPNHLEERARLGAMMIPFDRFHARGFARSEGGGRSVKRSLQLFDRSEPGALAKPHRERDHSHQEHRVDPKGDDCRSHFPPALLPGASFDPDSQPRERLVDPDHFVHRA